MKYRLITFISGFVIMAVELIAARIVAPIIGSSIFTWTSVIGIVLLGISFGNYFGGHLIDKKPEKKVLFGLLVSAAVFIALIPFLSKLNPIIVFLKTTLMLKTILISAILFFAPAFFLGSIFPAALKLYTNEINKIGKNAGLLSGLGALGSILGTFITGFLLFGLLGSYASLYILSLVLLAASIIFGKLSYKTFWIALVIIIILIFSVDSSYAKTNIVFENESKYYNIKIVDSKINGKDARVLFLDFDSHSIESKTKEKIGTYQETASIFEVFKKDLNEILVIGGGSYNFPKDFYDIYSSNIDVVEIDPEVTRAAENFFNLKDYPIKSFNTDGRYYLTINEKKYDLIFNDAFNSFISAPWYLSTDEANKLVKKRLNPDGVYIANIIASNKEGSSEWFHSFAKTFSNTFPNYYLIYFGKNLKNPQNMFFVGINSDKKIDSEKLENKITALSNETKFKLNPKFIYQPEISNRAIILKDNFAPVEKLTSGLIKSYIETYSLWAYSVIGF